MGIGVGWGTDSSSPPSQPLGSLEESEAEGKGETLDAKNGERIPATSLSSFAPTGASVRAHTQTHTHQLGEGGRAGLRSRGAGPRRGEPKRWGGTLKLPFSLPPPFSEA